MDKKDAMGLISMMRADVDSIKVLVTEVSDALTPDGSDYSKLHAVYEIAENQERMLEAIDNYLVQVKE